MSLINRLLGLITVFFSCFILQGATIVQHIKIDWSDLHQRQISVQDLSFSGSQYDPKGSDLPYYLAHFDSQHEQAEVNVTLKNPIFGDFEINDSQEEKWESVTDELELEILHHTARGQGIISIGFLPFVKGRDGNIRRLLSADLSIAEVPQVKPKSMDFAEHSKLSTGEWYKLSVSKDGMYKLDRSLLASMGIDVNSLNPNDINIYSQNQGMLPLANSVFRHDDLPALAIEVSGSEDGSFDNGDEVIFFARGPQRWEYGDSINKFVHTKHLFSDEAYVYLGIGVEPAVRVQLAELSDATATDVVNTFDDYSFHEVDIDNIVESGRQINGEQFGFQNTYTFGGSNFNFSNIDQSSQAQVKVRVVVKKIGDGGQTPFSVSCVAQPNGPLNASVQVSGGQYQLTDAGIICHQFLPTGDNMATTVTFTPLGPDSEAWLDYIRINCRRHLIRTGSQMLFRDVNSVGAGNVARFELSDMNASQRIWEVSDAVNPTQVQFDLNGDVAEFKMATDELREFIQFSNSNLLSPEVVGPIENQDLHSMQAVDMIIIPAVPYLSVAEKFAEFHREEGLEVEVVLPQTIYEEFSSGMQDVTGIKMFMKMFYDRAQGDETKMIDYLMFIGDGTYQNYTIDPLNSGMIPTHQSLNSESLTSSYLSDDYFGFLDDDEIEGGSGGTADAVDIGVGRIPAKSVAEAEGVFNKVRHYMSDQTGVVNGHCQTDEGTVFGDWRNKILVVGDDEDSNQHMEDADELADRIEAVNRDYNVDKVYLDAYLQESTPGGARYPEAQDDIKRAIQDGLFIISYSGHGGEVGWAQERILDVPTVQSFDNFDKMCIMLTATCEFSRYDDPDRTSAGELMILNPNGGAAALLTTTRLVFSFQNLQMGLSFYDVILRDNVESYSCPNGTHTFTLNHGMRIGDVSRISKNCTAMSNNNLNFSLLGDPAMIPNKPKHTVVTDSILDLEGNVLTELNALQPIRIKGHVENEMGVSLTDFNGEVEPAVYDKESDFITLQNDGGAPFQFSARKNIIYKGKATVQDGQFEFSFIVPRDISYQDGTGRLSYYALGDDADAKGHFEEFEVGGTYEGAAEDEVGPDVKVYLENEQFIDGGLTNSSPVLVAELFDVSGINTVGNGIGHDITVTIDGDTDKSIVLNDFYEAELDSYQSGQVRYQLNGLEDGEHTLEFKAWDIYNNSSKTSIDFVVRNESELLLQNVVNYPNPFTTNTEFLFEHNQNCDFLDVNVQVFTVSGKLVRSMHRTIATNAGTAEAIAWDGKDDFGDRIGKGVYVYKLKVTTPDGRKAEQFEKLVKL